MLVQEVTQGRRVCKEFREFVVILVQKEIQAVKALKETLVLKVRQVQWVRRVR